MKETKEKRETKGKQDKVPQLTQERQQEKVLTFETLLRTPLWAEPVITL